MVVVRGEAKGCPEGVRHSQEQRGFHEAAAC